MDISRTVARAMLRFHSRQLELRLEAGEDPGRAVDDYLRGVEPYVGIASDAVWDRLVRAVATEGLEPSPDRV